jgi:hypothetical protein
VDLGFGIPGNLQFVAVDFEAGDSWREKLAGNGFNAAEPGCVAGAARPTGERYYLSTQ